MSFKTQSYSKSMIIIFFTIYALKKIWGMWILIKCKRKIWQHAIKPLYFPSKVLCECKEYYCIETKSIIFWAGWGVHLSTMAEHSLVEILLSHSKFLSVNSKHFNPHISTGLSSYMERRLQNSSLFHLRQPLHLQKIS
jgi:hypothetical protein